MIREFNQFDKNKKIMYIGQRTYTTPGWVGYKPGDVDVYRCDNWMQLLSNHPSVVFKIKWKQPPAPVPIKEEIAPVFVDDEDDIDVVPKKPKAWKKMRNNKPNRMYIPEVNYYSDYAFTESDY